MLLPIQQLIQISIYIKHIMTKVFIDTNAQVALNSKNDSLHTRAISINKNYISSKLKYITTNFVLDETYTLLSRKVNNEAAINFGNLIRKSSILEIVRIDFAIEEYAWQIFEKYKDKEFSYTDCTSFAVMKTLKINKAFTSDKHFSQMGFEILL